MSLLADATVQEIQLELIRRALDPYLDRPSGVGDFLEENMSRWTAVLIDRICLRPDYHKPPMGHLYKLRDLPDNVWNADLLWLLTQDEELVRQIEKLEFDWVGDVTVYDPETTCDYVGLGRSRDHWLLSIWWD